MLSRWLNPNIRSERVRLPPLLEREIWYVHSHKRLGNFRRPVTFTEKVNWRILYDRRPILAWTCDKLEMKKEAARCDVPSARVYWSGQDLEELASVRLPDAWVLKPNHRSGLVHFGRGPILDGDISELKDRTQGWLDEKQARLFGEWAYSQARPCLLVEELIGDGESPPPDYKFYVFDGKPYVLGASTDRHKRFIRFYSPAWEPLPYSVGLPLGPIEEPPEHLNRMIDVASRLGKPFDFMRIDLYMAGSAIYLGEYTPYPNGGMSPYRPRSMDESLGAAWELPVCR